MTTEELARATDWCGVRSGRDYNKFKEMHLTTEQAQVVKASLIAESPLNIECQVVEIKELGSHDMFIANVVAVNYKTPSRDVACRVLNTDDDLSRPINKRIRY